MPMRAFVIASAASILLTGCVIHEHEHYRERGPAVVLEEPPAPRVEVRTVRPSEDHIWIDGHWRRVENRWDWEPGRWERRPRAHAEWVAGHWDHRDRGYVWVEGSWR